jgi:branched-chain amino acid aminotransferase
LITAPLDGTILPGVTRDSIISLTTEWGINVKESTFNMADVAEAINDGRVYEAFGAGTAAVVSPVKQINYKGQNYDIPVKLGKSGELAKRIWDAMENIQYGRVKNDWQHYIDEMRTYQETFAYQ